MENVKDYNKTLIASFVSYVVQAIINNFAPLLFITFQNTYDIDLAQITMLITVNFGVQLLVDILSVGFVDRLGYRVSVVIAHVLSALGLILLTILPQSMPNAYAGMLISVICCGIGGGLLEVLVSPIVEACPTDNKEKAMSLLHSFYCWGHVGVVLISTLFFKLFGIENWRVMALLWATVPIATAVMFLRVPIRKLMDDGEVGLKLGELFHMGLFWVLFVMMICSGASEQAVSQWASTFAEKGLGIGKTLGDLAGPMAFALMMGLARGFYGKFGHRINLDKFMVMSCVLCIASYLGIALFKMPVLSLMCTAICGMSVGIMWPGSFSKASASIPRGGTAMFALLALGGDIGCSGGPTLVGFVSGAFDDNLKIGILAGIVFPVLLLICILGLGRRKYEDI
ncbi:MAG: MFS transporter [Lachnospiraceae bacterium]|nr:MFS transporter [Lachnospiraceae bacterium]